MVTFTDAEWELIRTELLDERTLLTAVLQDLEVNVRHAGPNLNTNFSADAILNRAVMVRKFDQERRRGKYADAAIKRVEAMTK